MAHEYEGGICPLEAERVLRVTMKTTPYMRLLPASVIAVLWFNIVLTAAPLQRETISSEAKWLMHLDLDNLRETRIGKHLFNDVLQKIVAKPLADFNQKLNLDLDINKLQSLTAYGESFQGKPEASGVLLIRTGLKVDQLLRTVLAQQTNLAPQMNIGALELVQKEPFELFSIEGGLFLAPWRSMLLVAQSQQQLGKALHVINGKRPNLKSSKAFSDFPASAQAFFFLVVAEGFNPDPMMPAGKQQTNDPFNKLAKNLPPQAKILQMADSGRVVLGEKTDNVFVQLALKAKTSESATQIQQVLQGLTALLALSKIQDTNFFLPPVNITTETRTVMINVDYPVAKLMNMLADLEPKASAKPHKIRHERYNPDFEPEKTTNN